MKHRSLSIHALVLTLMTTLASLGAAVAQTSASPAGTPGAPSGNKIQERIDHRLQMLTQKLTLTPAQQGQVKSILENDVQSAEAIHNNASLPEDQKRAQFQSLKESSHSQINALLTPAQQQIFSRMGEEHHHPQGQQ